MSFAQLGTGVSKGIAIGPVHLLYRDELEIPEYVLPEQFIAEEQTRYSAAIILARKQLHDTLEKIPPNTPTDISEFIDTHLLMLSDSALSKAPLEIITKHKCNAEWALKIQRDALVRVFDEMEDPYLRTRRDDVDHVVNSIQRILLNSPVHHSVTPAQEHPHSGHILVTDDLSPADTVLMQHQGIAGFITEGGGPTSHTAILARSLGIPAIVGLHHARERLKDDETIIIDGQEGWILASPDELSLQHYHQKRRQQHLQYIESIRNKDQPAVTKDGKTIHLMANIELPSDIDAVHEIGAQGIGLYRTEFLFMNRASPPGEEEQFATYKGVIDKLNGKMLTIRTIDLGADKQVDGSSQQNAATNPALGLRAIRLCLKEPELFIPQLRAILRASAYGPIRILIPMLSNINELKLAIQIIDEVKADLRQSGIAFDENISIGGMIEVPAAAIRANMFLEHLDFLSIGTNDLIQYTLAIDRIDEEVNYLYDPLNPAVLNLIAMSINAGQLHNKPVAMCGEMAADPRFTHILLGLGLTEFSMHASNLPVIKQVINNSDMSSLAEQTNKIMQCSTYDDFISRLNKFQYNSAV
ncbi:MAG: phosphoenolpyruvate--protein phosphotransferase [Gammaproteobacteria bacterium]|nr:phosphoenolpyruvate--protein phosphotransferase [Gammaproteobacteria bacterium]